MALPTPSSDSGSPSNQIDSLTSVLKRSQETLILILVGASLSEASGIPSCRGESDVWRGDRIQQLASQAEFDQNPGRVWQYFSWRRHKALNAKPNAAHEQISKLAKRRGGLRTITQNTDGLLQQCSHPRKQLSELCGSTFTVKCNDDSCNYFAENRRDPITPALAISKVKVQETKGRGRKQKEACSYDADISDPNTQLPELKSVDLPHCPKCKKALLRPAVWHDDPIPKDTREELNEWMRLAPRIDLILVIGTGWNDYPAVSYVDAARAKGARVAVISPQQTDDEAYTLRDQDWFFHGDPVDLVPQIFMAHIPEQWPLGNTFHEAYKACEIPQDPEVVKQKLDQMKRLIHLDYQEIYPVDQHARR